MAATRPMRVRQAQITFALGLVVILWFTLGSYRFTWTVNTASALETRIFGMVPWLTMSRQTTGPMTAMTTTNRDWDVHGGGLIIDILVALALTLILYVICRRGIYKVRLVGQCDECGYDLTGLWSDVCPECGTKIPIDPRPGKK